ncbi:2,3-bisphosphoglycerate-dependent phosphoglycerate mutase [Egibacter rhizosphaerae]|uniref:2,3-bisphosphoglycerate-dependent phosphoglycerate mutase n=1 Tax=Egibacter rhizosphaerae TaxID=1670831 RepID=A0A411YKA2_9ACTN|nr:2,3-bisphosphoglycerate-dependent phosphoglycerate mutase [Egibacter rhizosphaerae]QBI21613.1 2,3-bisphosphoglycerate-dependent phosphoglycerate mutase [Egibacter rhizosphaerae]
MSTLILVRHGESEWNAENRFTGWVDVALSDKGRREAREGGERLAAEDHRVERAYTSTLQRAIETGQLVLEALGQDELHQIQAWELNERFYGALTGRNKAQTAEEFGEEQVHIWRRSYDTPPPGGESLKDTTARTLPYFDREIVPATREVDCVLVSAHGNSLRAIVKELDDISDENITGLEIPTGVPLVYEMQDGRPVNQRILHA